MDLIDLVVEAEAQTSLELPQSLMFAAGATRAAAPVIPTHAEVADPEAGWAIRNPRRAMAFLFVSPRDCAAVDELLAL